MLKFKPISFLVFIISALIVTTSQFQTRQANAQTTSPFLSSPYYDTKTITSYFDHESPNNIFTRYDGSRWTNPPTPVDVVNCTTGTNCYDGHDGTDFAGFVPVYGTDHYQPILAAASGEVTRAEWYDLNNRYSGYGLVVEIEHSNGYITRYGHLSSIVVTEGQFVTNGQVIGSVGSTGNSSNVHLHFGVKNANNQPVDPFGWSGNYADPWPYTSVWLWSEGEWAGSPQPFPQYAEIVVVDNGDSGFGKGCSFGNYWVDVSGTGYFGDMAYTYVDSYGNCYAQWQRTILEPGIYDVDAYVPENHATTWQADFRAYTDMWHHTKVDQLGTSNKWLSIGSYFFTAGSTQTIWISDYTGETVYTRKVAVDALRFKRRDMSFIYLPLIIK